MASASAPHVGAAGFYVAGWAAGMAWIQGVVPVSTSQTERFIYVMGQTTDVLSAAQGWRDSKIGLMRSKLRPPSKPPKSNVSTPPWTLLTLAALSGLLLRGELAHLSLGHQDRVIQLAGSTESTGVGNLTQWKGCR